MTTVTNPDRRNVLLGTTTLAVAAAFAAASAPAADGSWTPPAVTKEM
jgi:uncharacterized protein (DUF1501 family)